VLAAQLKRVWTSVAERGLSLLHLSRQDTQPRPIEALTTELLSERGEATTMARADEIVRLYGELSANRRHGYHAFLTRNFMPDPGRLTTAAETYLMAPSPEAVAELTLASKPPRQELIRRINVAPGGTALLVRMRAEVLSAIPAQPELKPLEQDLHHLLLSWFNRGFLELKRIDWNTSAALLEKLIAYEAVHEIRGWDDLRRRLAPDRRCFAFFHPMLPDEPLIFVEIALCEGLAAKIEPLLSVSTPADDVAKADTAIFYSINNCQAGLRGISFGNFLIKQVVEELRSELPRLKRFATLSPVPTFKRWLAEQCAANGESVLLPEDRTRLKQARMTNGEAHHPNAAMKRALQRLLAIYLTSVNGGKGPQDPVARFHLGNGARLERINWSANESPRGIEESLGMMVNYLYQPDMIEANHEQFATSGRVAYSPEVADLLKRKGNGADSRNGNGGGAYH
jgi:malonyl-CoA decarboxylase